MKIFLFGLLLGLPIFLRAQPLPTPVLLYPPNAASGQATALNIYWNAVAGADQYKVSVGISPSTNNLVFDTTYAGGNYYSLANLVAGTTYLWRIKAKHANPYQASEWSATWSFTVGSAPPPPGSLVAPTLVTPSANSVFQVLGTKLAWNAVTNATFYKVKIATDAAMSNVVFQNLNVVGTSLTAQSLAFNTQYFWNVQAANASSTGPVSATRPFMTMPDNPNAVATHPRLWLTQADIPRLRGWAVASNPVYTAMKTALNSANATYTTKFYPNGQPNPVWPDDGGVTWPTYCTEAYAQFFAFQSLIDPNPANRILYAQRARNLLMYVINTALPGAANLPFRWPTFANKDRMNAWGESFGLTVDWIYDAKDAGNNPILTAADKAKVRTVFMRWCSEQLNAYQHPNPIGLCNDKAMSITRWVTNNYYSGHARSLAILSLALDAGDDPVINPNLPADALGNSLRSYLFNCTGAWLYLQYALYEKPATVIADYGLPANQAFVGDASGGLSPESNLYGGSLGSVSGMLLALKTAGWSDQTVIGKQAKLTDSNFWNLWMDGTLHTAAPVGKTFSALSYLGPVYLRASYGDNIRAYVPADAFHSIGTAGILGQVLGNQTLLDKARWYGRNVIEGGAAKLSTRVGQIWGNNYASISILYFMLLDPTLAAPPDPRPSISSTFYDPALHRVLARSDWTANASWFTWQCRWMTQDHQNGDANQFELYRKGEWLIEERTGYANDHKGYVAEFHNSLCLQNDVPANLSWFEDQISARGGQWILGLNAGNPTAATSFGNNYIYANGDATNLYNRPNANPANAATDILHASRSIVWLKPDHIIVYDRAKSKTANRFKRFFLQFTALPTVSGKNATVATPGGQKVFLSNLLPAAAVLTASTTENLDLTATLQQSNSELKIEDPANPTDIRFLNIIQGANAGTAKDVATLLQSTAGTAFEGVVLKNKVILFANVWGAAFAGTSYTIPATVDGQLVSGLTPNAGYNVIQTPNGVNVDVTISTGNQLTADAGGVLLIGNMSFSDPANDREATPTAELALTAVPNPFGGATSIGYELAETAAVSLRVFDLFGKTVTVLAENAVQSAGRHSVEFSKNGLPAGVYFCELRTRGSRSVLRLVVE